MSELTNEPAVIQSAAPPIFHGSGRAARPGRSPRGRSALPPSVDHSLNSRVSLYCEHFNSRELGVISPACLLTATEDKLPAGSDNVALPEPEYTSEELAELQLPVLGYEHVEVIKYHAADTLPNDRVPWGTANRQLSDPVRPILEHEITPEIAALVYEVARHVRFEITKDQRKRADMLGILISPTASQIKKAAESIHCNWEHEYSPEHWKIRIRYDMLAQPVDLLRSDDLREHRQAIKAD